MKNRLQTWAAPEGTISRTWRWSEDFLSNLQVRESADKNPTARDPGTTGGWPGRIPPVCPHRADLRRPVRRVSPVTADHALEPAASQFRQLAGDYLGDLA